MTTTERHPIPAIACAPWCTDGDGHPDEAFRADQTCWGPSASVDLSLEEITHDSYGVYVPRIGVMAYRRRPTEFPSVCVHLDEIETHVGGRQNILDDSLHLTAEEAIALAAALLKAAEAIQRNQSGPPQQARREPRTP